MVARCSLINHLYRPLVFDMHANFRPNNSSCMIQFMKLLVLQFYLLPYSFAERPGRAGSTPISYSGGSGLKSQSQTGSY
jgi:hypothetical protein